MSPSETSVPTPAAIQRPPLPGSAGFAADPIGASASAVAATTAAMTVIRLIIPYPLLSMTSMNRARNYERLGGTSTALIAWITPFDALTSATITREEPFR